MGDEIAHALTNQPAERMSRATLMNAGLAVTAQAVEGNQIALGSAAMAAKLALELPNSRTAESEADRIGIELRSEEHTSELQSRPHLVCRLLLEKKKKRNII